MILYHGTGARRKQSIEQRGILPMPDSFVFASPTRLIGVVFAAARSELEDDFGLLVSFEVEGKWEEDPKFPDSVRCKDPVGPEKIVSTKIVKPDEELRGSKFLMALVKSIWLEKGRPHILPEKQIFVTELKTWPAGTMPLMVMAVDDKDAKLQAQSFLRRHGWKGRVSIYGAKTQNV